MDRGRASEGVEAGLRAFGWCAMVGTNLIITTKRGERTIREDGVKGTEERSGLDSR